MKELTRRECADWLLDRDRFLILTHIRPDGDTIGSAAALCRGLRKLGKEAHILENKGVSDHFRWLHQGLTTDAVREFQRINGMEPTGYADQLTWLRLADEYNRLSEQ